MTGPDYSISISGSGRVVNLVSPKLFREQNLEDRPTQREAVKEIGKIIYSHFDDVFDFIFLESNTIITESLQQEYVAEFYSGGNAFKARYYRAKNDAEGIGNIFDQTASFGSRGKLQGIPMFRYMLGLNRYGIHELMHHWGNYILETEYASHWWNHNVAGSLSGIGGWQPGSLKELGNGKYKATFPLTNGSGPYANFELYLMGLIGPDEVGHDIKIAHDFKMVDQSEGIFEASSITTRTMDEIIAENGKREPSYLTSQKDFRAMYVVLSEQPLTRQEWLLANLGIFNFQLQGDGPERTYGGRNYHYGVVSNTALNPRYNFWEATQGKATITFDQVDTFLTSPAALSALVSPPAVSIVGGDKAVSDTDSAAGESVSVKATATDSDGTIATTQWLVDGVEVATGLSATLSLPNGSTVVTFKATDDEGTSSITTATITVASPAYEPT